MTTTAPGAARILIVEDEVLVRLFAAEALEEAGFGVDQATGGSEALRLLEQPAGDLRGAVVDLGLPDRSGDELAAQIHARRPELPIVVASGRSEKELRERFAGDPRIGVLVKPYTASMLIGALASVGVHPR